MIHKLKTIANKIFSKSITENQFLLLALAIRLLYGFLSQNLKAGIDAPRYILLADQILAGDFNLDAGIFITAPFYPFFLAILRGLFADYWYQVLILIQALVSAISVICIMRITDFLFKDKQRTTQIAACVYCFYFPTFWYIANPGQETFFQTFLIVSVYFLLRFFEFKQRKFLIYSALFFALCFLTKSYILFWSPFIVFFILKIRHLSWTQKLKSASLYASICFLMTLPFGLYNLQKHNIYTLSSSGSDFFWWFGNSNHTYYKEYLKVNYKERAPDEYAVDSARRLISLSPPTAHLQPYLDYMKSPPSVSERQNMFRRNANAWIERYPDRFWELRRHFLFMYLIPALDRDFHSFTTWFFISCILLLLTYSAYWALYWGLKQDFSRHNWLLTLWLTMFVFSVVFSMQIRFKITTLDALFIPYASFTFEKIIAFITQPLGRGNA